MRIRALISKTISNITVFTDKIMVPVRFAVRYRRRESVVRAEQSFLM